MSEWGESWTVRVGPWRVLPAWAWLLMQYDLSWGMAKFLAREAP